MSSKLEERLLQFEKQQKIVNDEELLQVLEQIIDAEEALPLEERDAELIEEAVQFAVSLKYDDLGDEEVSEIAERIDPKRLIAEASKSRGAKSVSPKRKMKLRWLIPAAIVSVLLVVTIGAYALGYDLFGMAREAFAELGNKDPYKQDQDDIIKTDDYGTYYSLEEFEKQTSYSDILLPYGLANEYVIEEIIAFNYGESTQITFFMTFNGTQYETSITLPNSIDLSKFEAEKIADYDVVISEYDSLFQGEFVYKGNYYVVQTNSLENLKKQIEGMEEKQS